MSKRTTNKTQRTNRYKHKQIKKESANAGNIIIRTTKTKRRDTHKRTKTNTEGTKTKRVQT